MGLQEEDIFILKLLGSRFSGGKVFKKESLEEVEPLKRNRFSPISKQALVKGGDNGVGSLYFKLNSDLDCINPATRRFHN
jgi:hypothetical protein